jgi:signal transduction histidine kinase
MHYRWTEGDREDRSGGRASSSGINRADAWRARLWEGLLTRRYRHGYDRAAPGPRRPPKGRACRHRPVPNSGFAKFTELIAQALANADAREQLAASRARVVQAADAERRRLERNLHDDAQQRLRALSLMVRLAERQLPSDANASRALLAEAGKEFEQTLAELRELARGLHPAILTERDWHRHCLRWRRGRLYRWRRSWAWTADCPSRWRRPPITSWPRG